MGNFNFKKDKEKRQINPVDSNRIEESFVKELAKLNIGLLKCKEWLLWEKKECFEKLGNPQMILFIFESYLEFLTKYQIVNKVPEIHRVLMMYQICELMKTSLKTLINKFSELADFQKRHIYSTLTNLLLKQKKSLYEIVRLAYSIKPLTMNEQYKENLRLLMDLTRGTLDEFRDNIAKAHKIEDCIIKEDIKAINKVENVILRTELLNIEEILKLDESLKDEIVKYSQYTLVNNKIAYAELFDLPWLLQFDPKGLDKLAKLHTENTSLNYQEWGRLYEHSQIKNLIVNLLRRDGEEEAFDIDRKSVV